MTNVDIEAAERAFAAQDVRPSGDLIGNGADPEGPVDVGQQLAQSVPTIDPSPILTVTLPRGLALQGTRETKFQLRELNGSDEELITKVTGEIEWYNRIIALGVQSVGTVSLSSMDLAEREDILLDLLPGERTRLFLHICAAAWGRKKSLVSQCTSCGRDIEFDIDLIDDFPWQGEEGWVLDRPLEVPLSVGMVQFNLISGRVEADMLRDLPKGSPGQMVTFLLTKALANTDSGAQKVQFIRDLSMADRRRAREVIDSSQPRIDNEVDLTCPYCDEKGIYQLIWGELFRP